MPSMSTLHRSDKEMHFMDHKKAEWEIIPVIELWTILAYDIENDF